MDPARELAQLLECLGELDLRARRAARPPRRDRCPIRDSTRRSATDSATSRCCAPSCRFRSSARRAVSSARTSRARDARSSSSTRLRSVMSIAGDQEQRALVDLRERGARPGHREAVVRSSSPRCCRARPAARPRRCPRSRRGRRRPRRARRTSSQKTWPPISAGSYSRVCSNAMFAPRSVTTPSASIEAEQARRVVRDRVQEGALELVLELELLALRDVGAADEDEVLHAARHVGDRDRGPDEDARAAVGREDLGLDLLRRLALRLPSRWRARHARRRPRRGCRRTGGRRAPRRASGSPAGTRGWLRRWDCPRPDRGSSRRGRGRP